MSPAGEWVDTCTAFRLLGATERQKEATFWTKDMEPKDSTLSERSQTQGHVLYDSIPMRFSGSATLRERK